LAKAIHPLCDVSKSVARPASIMDIKLDGVSLGRAQEFFWWSKIISNVKPKTKERKASPNSLIGGATILKDCAISYTSPSNSETPTAPSNSSSGVAYISTSTIHRYHFALSLVLFLPQGFELQH